MSIDPSLSLPIGPASMPGPGAFGAAAGAFAAALALARTDATSGAGTALPASQPFTAPEFPLVAQADPAPSYLAPGPRNRSDESILMPAVTGPAADGYAAEAGGAEAAPPLAPQSDEPLRVVNLREETAPGDPRRIPISDRFYLPPGVPASGAYSGLAGGTLDLS